MTTLAEVESVLRLFTEGIAGRYYHLAPSSSFSGRLLEVPEDQTAMSADTLYLPAELADHDASAYRVLVMLQLGRREFGTYRFRMATARRRLPELAALQAPEIGIRESDFSVFFRHVEFPELLKRLFEVCEHARIRARLIARYPGLRPHLQRFQERQAEPPQPLVVTSLEQALLALRAVAQGADPALLTDASGRLADAHSRIEQLDRSGLDVYDSAQLALQLYRDWRSVFPAADGVVEIDPDGLDEITLEWLQRVERLESWEDMLDQLQQTTPLAVEEELVAEVVASGAVEGNTRDELNALSSIQEELQRKVSMEGAAVRDALGAVRSSSRSFRYDEWDYLGRRYLAHWCTLFEERLDTDGAADADIGDLTRVIQRHARTVMRHLEQIKPLGYQRVRRLADGDELDLNALIDARHDLRGGSTPDERVYSRRERVHRDVCAAFLIDLSASTDDPIDPPPPPAWRDDAAPINLRDPFEEDPDESAGGEAGDGTPRRIVDVQRESMLVMAAALERLGDSYGIYGFSGYGRDAVEFYVAKEPAEAFTGRTLRAIAAMKPKRSTRMGPAIRHATGKLVDSGNAMKLLIILSDGFPQDMDYGPDRSDHEYGVQDTAKALLEARAKGVEAFCVTVDASGNDYLQRMCAPDRYLVIDDIESLPERLSTVYRSLAGH